MPRACAPSHTYISSCRSDSGLKRHLLTIFKNLDQYYPISRNLSVLWYAKIDQFCDPVPLSVYLLNECQVGQFHAIKELLTQTGLKEPELAIKSENIHVVKISA